MLGYLFRLELEDCGADHGADCIDIEATLNLILSNVLSTIIALEGFDKDIISASGNVFDTK